VPAIVELIAYVPKNIVDLLSSFCPNRRKDINRLRAALIKEDWPELEHLAERLYAVGNPYGFRQITTYGRLMRNACAKKNRTALRRLITEYETYLSEVTIVQVDTLVTRHKLSAASRRILLGNVNPAEKPTVRAG
jgi:hypothetical protein